MKLYVYIGIVFLLILVLWWIYRKKNYYPYKARHLLTKENTVFISFYERWPMSTHCIICPKVGVKDLLSVTDKKQYMKYFHKIAQKHVDFVICDRDLYVLFAIELDDSTHETRDARKRDHLKDKAFAAAGIPLKRITEIDKKQIRKLFH